MATCGAREEHLLNVDRPAATRLQSVRKCVSPRLWVDTRPGGSVS
jgi:hypothetical protein